MDSIAGPADTSPEVSVVVPTRNRAGRLADLLASLRVQSLDKHRFEVVVVDDGSTDAETPELLQRELNANVLGFSVLRNERPLGPGLARDSGWRAAGGSYIAFIDDDCIATPRWLESGLACCQANPGAIVQGAVSPIPAESHRLTPFARSLRIERAGPYYETCNIFYPRSVLTAVGGFDTSMTEWGGEDADLAWRAIETGTPTAFAPDAQVHHAVHLGVLRKLRQAARWSHSMIIYKRHPALRRQVFTKGIFWKESHYFLMRVVLAVMLPKRLRFLRPYLVIPYLHNLELRCERDGGDLRHVLYYPVEDVIEVLTMVRASVEHRMIVL